MKNLLPILLLVLITASSAQAQRNHYHRNYHYHGYHHPYRYMNPYYCPPVRVYRPFVPIIIPRPFVEVQVSPRPVIVEKVYREPNYRNSSLGMENNAFEDAKRSIYAPSTDDGRLAVAEQVANGNYLSSNQVFEIMQLFRFESTKLEFAKFAYKNVVDKNNYYLVNNAFGLERSIQDLNYYIQNYSGK